MGNCCFCSPANQPSSCRVDVTSADLADLLYIQGLDAGLCTKFELASDIVCDVLSALSDGGDVVFDETQLVGADCRLYTVPETDVSITVIDTPCLDLTIAEPVDNQFVLTGSVIVDPDPDNALVCGSEGLFVPDLCEQLAGLDTGAPAVEGTLVLGTDCLFHPIQQALLTVTDSTCIDLTITGTVPQVLTADLIVSDDPDNSAQCRVDGLFVPSTCSVLETLPFGGIAVPGETLLVGTGCESFVLPAPPVLFDTVVTGADTPCISVIVNEPVDHNFVVSATPIVSTATGNQLVCTADGLFVPPSISDVIVQAADTSCINMTVTESPADTFTVSAVPIISPTAGNILTCTASGFFVPDTIVVAADSTSVDMTVTEAPDHTYTVGAVVRIANAKTGYPAGCNGLAIQATGLAAPPDIAGATGELSAQGPEGDDIGPPTSISSLPLTLNISNPSTCRSALLTISLNIPRIEVAANDPVNAPFNVEFFIYHEFNLPGVHVAPMAIYTNWNVQDDRDTDFSTGTPPAERQFVFEVPPGFVGTYSTEMSFTVHAGIGGVSTGFYGGHWHLVTI